MGEVLKTVHGNAALGCAFGIARPRLESRRVARRQRGAKRAIGHAAAAPPAPLALP
ncbi:MAG: hypothetical protein LCI02_18235 [Proteobacteria bacterium]|nr:hypothetical protein [Pseudomonadota bacterium]